MHCLHDFASKKSLPVKDLDSRERFSIFYHNIFDYPLTFSELIKWTPIRSPNVNAEVDCKNGYYFIKGRGGLIYKKTIRRRFYLSKIKIAVKASKIIGLIPEVKMVGLSGSLAMENASKDSDIDFIIVTGKGHLWTTRLMVYLILKLSGIGLRRPNNSRQKDKLCLNIWLDESDLKWNKRDRNFYTAHEILQIVPLINKQGTYEEFMWKNKWSLKFWPNVSEIKPIKNIVPSTKPINLNFVESLAFRLQYSYMESKRTNEVVTNTRAIFHPYNLSKKIVERYS